MKPASSRSLLFLLFLARALGDCINTVAGLSAGPAAASAYSSPQGVAVRGDGTLVFAAQNAVFAQQDDAGVVALAGRPLQKGFAGDGGPAGLALLSGPRGVLYLPEVDALLIADAGNARICRLFFSSGIVDTLAGTGAPGNGGDGGSPLLASFTAPQALAAHPASGDIFVADLDGVCVRRLRYGGRAAAWSNRSGGIIDTFLGTCGASANTTFYPTAGAVATLTAPLNKWAKSVTFDSSGTLYALDRGTIWSVAVGASVRMALLDQSATVPLLILPPTITTNLLPDDTWGLAVREDPAGALPGGRLVLLSSNNQYHRIYSVNASGALGVFLGLANGRSYSGDGGPALSASADFPLFLLYDAASSSTLFTDQTSHVIRRIDAQTIVSTVVTPAAAGGAAPAAGAATSAPAGAVTAPLATEVSLKSPRGIRVAKNGDVLWASPPSHTVLALRPDGTLAIAAGTDGVGGRNAGDGGPATAALLNSPYDVAPYRDGDFLVTVTGACVRRVSAATGVISRFAGHCDGSSGPICCGAGGDPALSAYFRTASMLAVDAAWNVYISDVFGFIRFFNVSSGLVFNIAGTGRVLPSYPWNPAWEGAPATTMDLQHPTGLALSPDGSELYFSDTWQNYFGKINVRTGVFNRVMGLPYDRINTNARPASPTPGGGVLGIPGPSLNVSLPCFDQPVLGIAFDKRGNLLAVLTYLAYVVEINVTAGWTRFLAGTGEAVHSGDGGDPAAASVMQPRGIDVDAEGNIFFTDSGTNTVREIARRGEVPSCPEGYVCACGLRPEPCTDARSFCPRGSTETRQGSAAYATVANADGRLVAQRLCPPGAYCPGGAAVPCPPGTFGVHGGQASAGTCARCPAGKYSPLSGVAALPRAPAPCLPAPRGFAAAEGAPFPVPCPAQTALAVAGAALGGSPAAASPCAPCSADSFAPPGSAACLPFDAATDATSTVGGVFTFQRNLAIDDGNMPPAELNKLYLKTALSLVAVFATPLLLYLCAGALAPALLPAARLHGALAKRLPGADVLCDMAHGVEPYASPRSIPTALGGGISALFVGVFLAFCAMLTEQFARSNTLTTLATLELTAFEAASISKFSDFVTTDGLLGALFPGGVRSGMAVALRTAGPRCAAPLPNGTTWSLAGGAWGPVASTFDAATGAGLHVFRCEACLVDGLSALSVDFDSSCGAVDVAATAVGGVGSLSLAAFSASGVAAVTATLTVTVQNTLDFVQGKDPESTGYPWPPGASARGLFLSSITVDALPLFNATAIGAGDAPPVRVTLKLPAAAMLTRYTMVPVLSVLQLVSNLVGNLGVLGGAVAVFQVAAMLQRNEKGPARVASSGGGNGGDGGGECDESRGDDDSGSGGGSNSGGGGGGGGGCGGDDSSYGRGAAAAVGSQPPPNAILALEPSRSPSRRTLLLQQKIESERGSAQKAPLW